MGVRDALEVLGVSHQVGSPHASLLQPQVHKALLRASFLEYAPLASARKRALVRILILPIFIWCSFFVADSPEQSHCFDTLRTAILKAFIGRTLVDAPRCIKQEFLGWPCDPLFASLKAALQFAIRFHVHGFTWPAGAEWHNRRWYDCCPKLCHFLQANGWWWSDCGSVLYRTDAYGIRRQWILGADHISICLEWIQHFAFPKHP